MSERLVGYCLMIVAASVCGGLIPLLRVITHVRMQIYLSFAAGVMLGSALLHMLPESAEIGGPSIVAWALPGLLTLFMIERFFSYHHHEFPSESESSEAFEANHGENHDHSSCDHDGHVTAHNPAPTNGMDVSNKHGHHARIHWQAAAIGLALHSLLGGVALASAEMATPPGTWAISGGVFLATLLHKPADALTITSLMRHGRVGAAVTHVVNFLFSLMIPLGALLFEIGQTRLTALPFATIETFTGAALAFSAGTFLCISLSDLLPELHFHSHDRVKLSAALIAGVAIMAVVALFGE